MKRFGAMKLFLLYSALRKRNFLLYLAAASLFLFVVTSVTLKSAVTSYSYVKCEDISGALVPRSDLNSSLLNLCPATACDSLDWMNLHPDNLALQISFDPFARVRRGGVFSPTTCTAQYEVTLVVPYRNRASQLEIFLKYMHAVLQLQKLQYRIVVVEQTPDRAFNRGKLFNIGFRETLSRYPHSGCFIFHDVDLLPLNWANIYACSKQPRHISSALDEFRFNLPYRELFGGAVALTASQFEKSNGFSNEYYGWGGEDDDFSLRVREAGFEIMRFDPRVARFTMLKHVKEVPNPDRFRMLDKGKQRIHKDGLNSLTFQVRAFEERALYTWYLVDA